MTDNANHDDTLTHRIETIESFGTSLRRERELRSIPLEDVSLATNIQLSYLQAIEEDDLKKLPHTTFVKGFIRSYASYIGLNPDNVITNFEHFMASISDEETNDKPLPNQEKKNSWVLVVVISIAILILILLGYYLVSSLQSLGKQPASTSQVQPISPSGSGHTRSYRRKAWNPTESQKTPLVPNHPFKHRLV